MTQLKVHDCIQAPKPLGNYSHAASYGGLIFVAGIASRDFATNEVPGLKIDNNGKKISYDIRLETRATLENIKTILNDIGSDLEHVIDVNVFLLDMKDFVGYNEIYAEYFPFHRPARTTVAVVGLPGDIAIEMKVVATKRD